MIADCRKQGKWQRVSAKQPCPICKKESWCSISKDGRVVLCRQVPSSKQKQDKTGTPYWVHRLANVTHDGPRLYVHDETSSEQSIQPADADTLDRVYRLLLDHTALGSEHREMLIKRGLTPEAIKRRSYRTVGRGHAAVVQHMLVANPDLEKDLPLVPGFVKKQDADGNPYWTLAGQSGVLIPVRDALGRIVALMTRLDDVEKGKYRYLSSQFANGPGPGAPLHVPLFEGNRDTIRVTEGVLKADIATELSGILTVGLPGVSGWKSAAPLLKELGAKTVVLAFDADASVKPPVALALRELAGDLKGFTVEVETWDIKDGKGIDDLLASGKTPTRLQGDDVGLAIEEIVGASKEAARDSQQLEPLLDAADPHRLAKLLLENSGTIFSPAAGLISQPTLKYWRDEWFAWDGAAYRAIPDEEIKCRLCGFMKEEFDRINIEELRDRQFATDDKESKPPKSRKVTTQAVSNTLQALGSLCLLSGSTEAPTWLAGEAPFPANEILVAANGIVHLPSLITGMPSMIGPTPDLFSTVALDYEFQPDSPEPAEWLKFLKELWPDDQESIDALQEWFGLCLLPDTSYQKMLLLVGPPRSGKGTIARVLTSLIGKPNVAGPTLASLGKEFGLAPLVNKSLAIVPDARLSGREDSAMLTERILATTGEDTQTVNRKFRDQLQCRLPTRLMLLSNELPKLTDASEAILSRMILLRMTQSWLHKEDRGLLARLEQELPGILHWAIAGWLRLQERGYFKQPKSSGELIEDWRALVSPIGSFIKECCVTDDPEAEVVISDLFKAWQKWCLDKGHTHPGTEPLFGRNLRAALPGLRQCKPRQEDGKQRRAYQGVGLKREPASEVRR